MKTFRKLLTLCLALALCLSMIPAALAANAATATIDTGRKASLNLWKYDFTTANADGVLEKDSYVSSGIRNDTVESALADYAIQGVVFSYLKIADISTYSALEDGQHKNMVLYGMADDAKTAQLLSALGLVKNDAYRTENKVLYFTSDVLNNALSTQLTANASAVKDALENVMAASSGTALPETDVNGHSGVQGLDLGLYLVVETYVPENVSITTAPFLVSLPMTTVDGTEWNYDVTVYPKNETDSPDLEKTLREAKPDTGKHDGSNAITDGYAHTGTGSDGDVVEYQIISTLPTITSNATALTTYTFLDALSKGITYNKNDVKLEWYKDAACTQLITAWEESTGKFTVTYGDADNGATMEIAMTADGLQEINHANSVYDESSVYHGYSGCTVRITYACTVNSDADVVYGDNGNPNEVTLTWKRTNTDYYDTLQDDCHFYTYGLDLLKQFSDGKGNFSKVQFVMHNNTDNYWVVATLNEAEGIYYVTGHADKETGATKFVPTKDGKITVKGLEDDAYTLTEVQTDNGYTLLKNAIEIVITAKETETVCPTCGKALLTASATVNGKDVAMNEDNSSVHALVPLTVVNTKGFDLPTTGENGLWVYGVFGVLLMAAAIVVLVLAFRKKAQK